MYGNETGAAQGGGYVRGGGGLITPHSESDKIMREPEATRFLNELEKNLTHCDASLHELAARLERVTRSEPPSTNPTTGPAPREVPQTSLGGSIQELADRAAALSHRVRHLTARLEV